MSNMINHEMTKDLYQSIKLINRNKHYIDDVRTIATSEYIRYLLSSHSPTHLAL